MTQWQLKSKRKNTGGVRHSLKSEKKRLSKKGSQFSETTVQPGLEKNIKVEKKVRGGASKQSLKKAVFANVLDKKAGKQSLLEIIRVVENQASRDFARRNIVTKGAVIEVKKDSELVKARVTNRPGQEGAINAVIE